MKRKLPPYVLPIAIVALGVVAAVVLTRARPRVERAPVRAPAPLVRVIQAEQRDVQLSVTTQGTVLPRTESTLVAEVSGRVLSVSDQLAAGGFFDAGEELLAIDPADYRAAVTAARSQVAQAKLRLAQEEQEAAMARRDWQDLGSGEAPTALTLREPQLEQARASLSAAEADLARARRNLARASVSVPYAGRVRSVQVDVGQFVAVGQPLAQVYAVDLAEVRLPLPDSELAFVDVPLGDPGGGAWQAPTVILRGELAGARHEWLGRVVRTEGEIDPKSRMVHVVAAVEDPYGRQSGGGVTPLPIGLFVEAEIMGVSVEDCFVLPRSGLRRDQQVWVVDGDDRLRFRSVDIIRIDRERVYVGAGLADGDLVCVSPLETAVDGMTVRTAEAQVEPLIDPDPDE